MKIESELIIVIVITAIITAVVSVFVTKWLDSVTI